MFNIFIISVLLAAKFASASGHIQCECHLLLHCDWLSEQCYGGHASHSNPTITLRSQQLTPWLLSVGVQNVQIFNFAAQIDSHGKE